MTPNATIPSAQAGPRRLVPRAGLAALAAGLLGCAAPLAMAAGGGTATPALPRGVVDITTTLADDGGTAAGTGMLLTSSGVVLTNNHVIEGSSDITVTDVTTGRRYSARVLGTDSIDDVAVLQLANASGLPTVSLGDSGRLSVGDAVRAVGNAGGTGGTPSVAPGRIVDLAQAITVSDTSGARSEHLGGLIQVDAALEPGDSGGPLMNAAGQVVGMDTAASVSFRFRSGSSEGYAIPINRAMSIGAQIRSGRASARVHVGPAARLGVEVVGADQAPGAAARGAVIAGVAPGTPAEGLGLGQGDVIVSLGGHTVTTPTGLSNLMQRHHPGDRVRVGWIDATGASRSGVARLATGPPA